MFAAALAAAVALAPAPAGAALYTNTSSVEALAVGDGLLWVATRGGLEAYDPATLTRRHLYTTADGLEENVVRAVEVGPAGLVARTERATCTRTGQRFTCVPAAAPPAPLPDTPALFHGARVTATLVDGGRRFVGTAGQGVWLAGARARRLTPPPEAQICSNHVVAVASFAGRTWFGTFDEGLCSFDRRSTSPFRRAPGRFRMINDLAVAGAGRDQALYVASTAGLFRTRDGQRFQRVHALDGRGAVDLAADGDTLWAISAGSLWRLPVRGPQRPRRFARPAGSGALQAVDVSGGVVWLASEDAGVLRLAPGTETFQIFDRAAGLPSSWTVDVAATPDGGAYAATLRHGLVRIDPDGTARAAGAPLPDRWLLHVSAGARGAGLWIGTQGGGAWMDTQAGRAQALPDLPDPRVHAFHDAPDGGTWIGTEGGTVRITGPPPAAAGAVALTH
jgi:ligand-binding sensor domain-containing protein